jgi:site-specific recombinase XerC
MMQAIEDYLTFFSDELHPEITAEGREVIVRYCRGTLLEFSSVVGDVAASDLQAEHVERYVAALDEQGIAKGFKEAQLGTVRKFCAWLVRTRVLKKNPVHPRLCGPWWQRGVGAYWYLLKSSLKSLIADR